VIRRQISEHYCAFLNPSAHWYLKPNALTNVVNSEGYHIVYKKADTRGQAKMAAAYPLK